MDENQNMHTDPVTGEPVMEPAFPDPAAPMQEMIPTQTDAPEGDTVAEGEIPEVPEDSAVIGGAFYGDPHAPVDPQPQYQYEYQPVQPQPVPAMNRRIYTMAAVIAVLIFLLCVFCIISDLMHGALGGSEQTITNEVIIKTQPKPDLDPEDANVNADGTYTVRGIAELVKPSIVEIYAFMDESCSESSLTGTGSGVIISEDGYIITNAHVLEGEYFLVILDDGTEFDGSVIGSDTKTDLAVLKIEAKELPAAMLGDSDEVYVGENVVAIGNPAGLTGTVTQGIVSAVDRQVRAESNAFIMSCIQTDAAISPGNSGGALVNMYGQVIGITSSKYANSYITGNAYEGLGFAITINQALPIVEELITQGYVSGRFRIGITFLEAGTESAAYYYEQEFEKPLPEELTGLWIQEISEDCDIANTELQPYDFILSMNGVPVDGYDTVLEVLDGFEGGDTVTAECARVEEDDSITYFEIEFKLEEDTSGNF
ncbi:MAG: trypsin-like peptidase domain-containing protein [Oscillospiraceae bacterium]|nr:trypsin-like peptidase domain-containing protein [Oscillospiraceae bacterium]MBQ8011793.1 trypsin-like peptidase domain-containing protein [Oscillospiraceae bacterium]